MKRMGIVGGVLRVVDAEDLRRLEMLERMAGAGLVPSSAPPRVIVKNRAARRAREQQAKRDAKRLAKLAR